MRFRFGDHLLDLGRVELRHRDVSVKLEPQVFDVLAYLVVNRDRMVTKEEILDNVWGDRFVSEAALSSRIAAARKAVGDDGPARRTGPDPASTSDRRRHTCREFRRPAPATLGRHVPVVERLWYPGADRALDEAHDPINKNFTLRVEYANARATQARTR